MNPAVKAAVIARIERLREDYPELDADEILRADMLEGLTDMDDVLRYLVRSINYARFDEAGAKAALDEAEKRYGTRINSAKRKQETARACIEDIMTSAGLDKRKLPEGSISITHGKPSLWLEDGFTPPQGYERIKVEPDKDAIKAAVMAGERIPGAEIVVGKRIVTVR
jgi:hypothetical protein